MSKYIDLHTHSTASDGSMSPRELVQHAKEAGLAAIALTDHDTVDGISEAMEEAARVGIELIPGVEIGAEFKPEMHILGYFFGNTYLNIRDTLVDLRKSREERNPKIIDRLNELGFEITLEEVKKVAKGNVVGRPHIAKVLMSKGYVKSMQDAFERYLGSGKAAYFKKDRLTPEQGISEIIKAGGVPVLAHPIFLCMSNSQLDTLFGQLKSIGLAGIEGHYVENSADDTGNLLRLAIKHDLLVTGGSDFHGKFKPDIRIGKGRGNLEVPYELVEKLKAWKK